MMQKTICTYYLNEYHKFPYYSFKGVGEGWGGAEHPHSDRLLWDPTKTVKTHQNTFVEFGILVLPFLQIKKPLRGRTPGAPKLSRFVFGKNRK